VTDYHGPYTPGLSRAGLAADRDCSDLRELLLLSTISSPGRQQATLLPLARIRGLLFAEFLHQRDHLSSQPPAPGFVFRSLGNARRVTATVVLDFHILQLYHLLAVKPPI